MGGAVAARSGGRRTEATDHVLATVLFVDIVCSTTVALRLGDRRCRDLLERYYAVLRRELGRFRGREIDTVGGGLLAAFDSPARAVRCACSRGRGAPSAPRQWV